jgi:uncharacterized membrane protein YqhA
MCFFQVSFFSHFLSPNRAKGKKECLKLILHILLLISALAKGSAEIVKVLIASGVGGKELKLMWITC